ncbi:MAG: hypothetical protein INF92_10820 [Rhodobacter sp.]|nr:hypothetical protein [Rhodobacter sp.]
MTWDQSRRAYYFGGECISEVLEPEGFASDCLSGAAADLAFLERYCAPDRRQRQNDGRYRLITGTATCLRGVPIALVRCIISKITELVPDADHATPGWNWRQDLRPALVIGHLTRDVKIKGARCGLWVEDDKLYFWANKDLLEAVPPEGWEPYGNSEGAGARSPMLRFSEPISWTGVGPGDAALPKPVEAFLRRFAEGTRASLWHEGPLVPREVCAARSSDENAVDFDDAADDPDVDQARDTDHNPCGDEAPREQAPGGAVVSQAQASRGEPTLSEEIKHAVAHDRSMLAVLRAVLVARIRTQLPNFGQTELNKLILATGYPAARAPESDIADLVFVMAASITNAAGGRPDWKEFAPATVQAMRTGGALGAHSLTTPVTAHDLARWFDALRSSLPANGRSQRMDRFLNSAAKIAGSLQGNPVALDRYILMGVAGFCHWLQTHYEGDARALHDDMTLAAAQAHDLVLRSMAALEQYPGIGVAVAANFLKDSQVPPLVALGVSMANVEAGWSAKPDLHVLRFMAKLTRDVPLHVGHKRQSLRVALRSFEQRPPVGAEPGCFPNSYPFANGRRGEYRAIEDIHHWADAVTTSALEIERVLYLIGATRVEVDSPSGLVTINSAWYRHAEAAIDCALERGVHRMS